ncbi:MAG: hypothetical protein PHQ41_07860 [Candidatus Cloacimonetes bacterium]|nr:hypothetical protein [Candidatus Cloacimonadota bacterium]
MSDLTALRNYTLNKQGTKMDCLCKPEIKEKIDSVHEEIYGNGDSSKSLVTRMARVETNMKILLSVSTSQFFLLLGIALKMFFGN